MPLDEATTRFAFLMQRDVRRLGDASAGGRDDADGREGMKYDSVARIAVFESRGGRLGTRLYGETLATYGDDRILRWAWAGRATNAGAQHGDAIFREGQLRGVPQLAMSLVTDLDEADAVTLGKLGALVARAEGFLVRRDGDHVELIGLFDRRANESTAFPSVSGARSSASSAESAAASRISVPPPPVAPVASSASGSFGADPSERRGETPSPKRAAPYRSLPPIREVWEPRASRSSAPPRGSAAPPQVAPIREPNRAAFLPVANAALGALARSATAGWKQALFAVTLERLAKSEGGDEKRRLLVQLVVLDAQGLLRALDPPLDLVDAAARMVDADRASGNGPWRKLSVRIVPKPDGGATLHVDVV